MISFTFKQLQVFVYTARLASLSRAAEKCCITQAAASMSLLQLEQILNKPLFDRLGKRLQLNTNGEHLLPVATAILSQAQAMQDEAFSAPETLSGILKLGASTTIANYLMPKIIAAFKQNYPRIRVEFVIANSATIVERLNRLELDLGYVEGDVFGHNLNCKMWMEDELLIVCNLKHPLVGQSNVTMDDLSLYPWLFREEGSGTRKMFHKAMKGEEQFKVEMVLNRSEAIVNYLMNSHCLSYLSKFICNSRLNKELIATLKVSNYHAKRNFYQLLHPDKYQTIVCRRFVDFVAEFKPNA